MSGSKGNWKGSHPYALATTWLGVRPPKNSQTGPYSPPSFFARWNRRQDARLSSATIAIDNNDKSVDGLRRLSYVPRLEGRRFRRPSKIACDPNARGNCPRFRTDNSVGNARLPVALFCSTALLLPFLPPTTPRQLGAMVCPSPAAWQVRSAKRHFGR